MTKITLATLTLCTALWAPTTWADPGGSCHFHGKKPATEATVSGCALQRKDNLVKTGKLDAAWSAARPASIEAVDGKKGKEWRVIYKNPAVADKAKTSLFIFFTPVGNFIAANHTGQ